MKQIVITLWYTLIGLAIGIIISEQLITQDTPFKFLLRDTLLQYFQRMYTCNASANLHHINLLQGTITLTDIIVQPHEVADDWSWQSNHCIISISPFAWFFTKSIPVQLTFDNFTINTRYQNKTCSIIPHFQQLFKVPETPTPFFIHQLSLAKLQANIHDEQQISIAQIHASFEMLWQNNSIENHLIISNATITQAPIPLKLQGSAHLSIFNPLGDNIITSNINTSLSCVYHNQTYYLELQGNWHKNTGTIHIMHNTIELARIDITSDGSFKLYSGNKLPPLLPLPITYTCNAYIQGMIHNPLASVAYVQVATSCPPAQLTSRWRCSSPYIYGLVNINYKQEAFTALVCCNVLHQQAFIYMYNTTDLQHGLLSCPAGHITLLARINCNAYIIDGKINSYTFHAHGQLNPALVLPGGWIQQNAHKILTFWPNKNNPHRLHGSLDCSYIAPAQLQTSGSFDFVMDYHYPSIAINGSCTQPWVIPALGNSITQSSTRVILNLAQQILTIPHIQCTLSKGNITITDGRITPDQIIIPITIKELFVCPNSDVRALVGAQLQFKKDTTSILQGTITIDQCYYAKNILAAELTQQIISKPITIPAIGNDINLSINVKTVQPINVKTAFLTGQVHAYLQLNNTILKPIISGSLDIAQATLHFPYKPLHINQGSITFLPYQPFDPLINVTAKNRIKKYQVTLRAHGTIHDPIIHLEASPSLSSEQIIALLLTGSEERSLAITVPTLLMQQIQQLMFGPTLVNSSLAQYFKIFTKPFKNIRFIPHLTDQSARGGIRAGLEINYNDNLRAYIQKNLTLTEDTYFEVEYQCTDHVSIRGIKDEHGDLGAEVEMRWKFK